jgi:hypothetical protein
MRKAVAAAIIAAVGTFGAVTAAQKTTQVHPGKGGSPHVKSEWTVDGANISIEYGRPSLKGRPLAKLAPAGQVWRLGADEATTLVTSKALKFGNVSVPAGKYTLYAVPGDAGWQLVINKQTGQWGTEYADKQDLGRVPMTVGQTAAPVEQLTISVDDTPAGGTVRIEFGGVSAKTDFTVG